MYLYDFICIYFKSLQPAIARPFKGFLGPLETFCDGPCKALGCNEWHIDIYYHVLVIAVAISTCEIYEPLTVVTVVGVKVIPSIPTWRNPLGLAEVPGWLRLNMFEHWVPQRVMVYHHVPH